VAKSVKALLERAKELALIAGITSEELVDCSVSRFYINFHLKPLALARVFRSFGLSRGRLKFTTSEHLDVHLEFEHRGATWATCVLAKDYDAAAWCDLLAEERPRLEFQPLLLGKQELQEATFRIA
jgi:hypothetical protein